MTQLALFDPGATFENRSVKATTFLGKMSLPIHRWYRLTPSFSPKLATDIAEHFHLGSADLVLDPFSGVGTVPLCMKYRGIPSCSVEINPYLHFVGTVKTRTYTDIDGIRAAFRSFVSRASAAIATIPRGNAGAEAWTEDNRQFVPLLNHIERWWSPGNLAQLVAIRREAMSLDCDPMHADLIRMGILGILVPVSNAKHNHVSLTFAKHPLQTVDVLGELKCKFAEMVEDLLAVREMPCADATVYLGNSKNLTEALPRKRKPSAVITSPPYPNRFSYARETRPHLFFFDFFGNASQVGELETRAIGGTWGKATSVLADGVEPLNDCVKNVLSPYVNDIHGKGSLMAHYVVKYFNDIYIHAEQIATVCKRRCRLAYVIGNSKFYDHPLPSDEILANIFRAFGFTTERIDRMRRRQSKTGLYEAVVFMKR